MEIRNPEISKQGTTLQSMMNTNSVRKGFDTAMRKGSSRRFKPYPTTYTYKSVKLTSQGEKLIRVD